MRRVRVGKAAGKDLFNADFLEAALEAFEVADILMLQTSRKLDPFQSYRALREGGME